MKSIGKKGELMTKFIISIIILVVSFVVILFLVFQFDTKSSIDKEVCHQSIVLRGTANLLEAGEAIPLNCKTEKICITMSGNDCVEFTNTKNDPINKIKISSNPEIAREEIMEVFADNMVSCHNMLGEGKINFFPNYQFDSYNYGLICNWIVFDQQIKDNMQDILYPEFYNYLGKQTINDQSYLEYLYPGWKNSVDSIEFFESYVGNPDSNVKDVSPINWRIVMTQEKGYAIVAQMTKNGNYLTWISFAGATVVAPLAVVALASGVGAPVAAVLLAGSTTIAGASAVTGGAVLWYSYDQGYEYSPPSIYPFEEDIFNELGINVFEIAP